MSKDLEPVTIGTPTTRNPDAWPVRAADGTRIGEIRQCHPGTWIAQRRGQACRTGIYETQEAAARACGWQLVFPAGSPDAINRAATFLPQVDGDTRPCITIGGVQVYAYLDRDGSLRVSVDTDTSELPEATPVVFTMNGDFVYAERLRHDR